MLISFHINCLCWLSYYNTAHDNSLLKLLLYHIALYPTICVSDFYKLLEKWIVCKQESEHVIDVYVEYFIDHLDVKMFMSRAR